MLEIIEAIVTIESTAIRSGLSFSNFGKTPDRLAINAIPATVMDRESSTVSRITSLLNLFASAIIIIIYYRIIVVKDSEIYKFLVRLLRMVFQIDRIIH